MGRRYLKLTTQDRTATLGVLILNQDTKGLTRTNFWQVTTGGSGITYDSVLDFLEDWTDIEVVP